MRASVRRTEATIRSLCRTKDGNRRSDIDWEGDIEAWENGVRIPWKEFYFKAGYDIYSDGSALDTKYRELARGAGAAVQRTEEGGWRGFIIRVPFGLPKGAAVPEQLAGSLALKKCPCISGEEGQTSCIVTDCEAVMKVAGSRALKCHHKSIFAGLWWELPWNRAVFKKVRSHQPEEKVGLPGEISRE